MFRTIQVVLAAAFLSSCVTPSDIVRQRASLERHCPEDSIQVTALPGSAYRADGCGRSETFVCIVDKGSTQACTKEPGGTTIPDAGAANVH
jgi:hypothetical protein